MLDQDAGGQLLAQLDERELAARRSAAHAGSAGGAAGAEEAARALEAAQSQAEMAKKTYDRYMFLRQQKSVSQQEFDEAETRQRAAQANLAAARARLEQAKAGQAQASSEAQVAESVASYARITAPFDGRVTRRLVESGTMITPGTPLFTVEGSGTFQLEATISSEALGAAAGT
ncbi:MAG: efflux RND transporter periplasmic adaptor subunit, partial [Acidobacteriia bacterium]|nr:efflux RND transporter periplasmic adaptor subunit [Terriglobia bacterium]